MVAQFSRLLRFEDAKGQIHYGEAGEEWQQNLIGRIVPTYDIADAFAREYHLTGEKVEVHKVKEAFYWQKGSAN